MSRDPIIRDPFINRDAMETLERGSLAVEYAFTLCHAIMDRLETLDGLHGPKGIHANGNTKASRHCDDALQPTTRQADRGPGRRERRADRLA